MDCRTTPAVSFKHKLGFNQQDPIMTQEQSILTKIRSIFPTESIIFQCTVLGYRIDAYFEKHRLLSLKFKSNDSIKTKCLRYVVKKIFPKL